jgi:hypothetical protein
MTASYIALLFSIHDLKLSLAFKMEGGSPAKTEIDFNNLYGNTAIHFFL